MDFISIDFETATSDRNSPCEIGLTFIKENNIVETKSWLIKPIQYPYFDSFNVHIHGITPKDVAKQPEFDVLWRNEILPLVDGNFLMAHNAGFDFSVLRKTLETYSLPFPELQYSCSYIISKKIIKGLLSYDLASLCHYSSLSLPNHRAGDDSKACAELSLKLFETSEVFCLEDFPGKLATSIGRLYNGGYNPSRSKHEGRSISHTEIQGDPERRDSDSVFYGSKVVFTGTLSSMSRADAWKIIADIGGINSENVSKETDFLVVGQQDFRIVGEDGMSRKQEKAKALLEKGHTIEVVSEADFLRSISSI
jgi:DNA polymerase-3 subunit epsilon